MKFAHITDTQLGYVQYGLPARERDFENAFEFCIKTSIDNKVDAVLFGGDLFEHQKPLGRVIRFVQAAVERLKKAKIRVLGVEGNHDWSNGNWLTVCGIENLENEPVEIDGVTFAGMHYRRDKLFDSDFQEWASSLKKIDVAIFHQAIIEKTPFTTVEGSSIIKALKPKGMKYMALGHIHGGFSIDMDGVKVICPGSTEMTDINEAREKRFPIVDITAEGVKGVQMYDIPVRPIIYYTVETEEDLTKLSEMIEKDNLALVVASVNKKLIDGALRLETLCSKHDAACRISKHQEDQIKVAEAPTWEREKATIDLKKHVGTDYDPKSVEYGMIMQMLATPEQAVTVFTEFIDNQVKELTDGRSKKAETQTQTS